MEISLFCCPSLGMGTICMAQVQCTTSMDAVLMLHLQIKVHAIKHVFVEDVTSTRIGHGPLPFSANDDRACIDFQDAVSCTCRREKFAAVKMAIDAQSAM